MYYGRYGARILTSVVMHYGRYEIITELLNNYALIGQLVVLNGFKHVTPQLQTNFSHRAEQEDTFVP